ncbi:PREDICTED: 2-acylglycerol O-acyltransferase 2-like [Rhagoletis zephyria]|uniref:2-acylglycerol O-acyltransferase 2-like n=1 Tax=Rhagoletis zephyria TaxID=28612 RepID=UPI00081124CB|nr:PREDICTED: 2-acylglycerol O-acyltransferase 2-like [Rhagoletis zephyria]XP_036330955.1 2-acylglycerol O-acyltransferase 2-like [Rhagoletis pomonella]
MKRSYAFQKIKEVLGAVSFFLIYVAFFSGWIVSIRLIFYGSLFWKSLILIYILYIQISSAKCIFTIKGNGLRLARSNWLWKSLRRYFPIELVKTEDLPANRHYLFATFPHGVLTYGSAVNAGFDIDNWLALFPGIRPKHTVLNLTYVTPLLYDFFRLSGFISVSEKSVMNHLTSRWKGDGFSSNGVVIVVGGAQEALDSRPGQYELSLLKRKGFVRVAIKSGAAIVPCFTFGEVDSFDRWDGKWALMWQLCVKRLTGISLPLMKGRGGFPMPFRRRIVQVVGAPIEVQQSDIPRPEYVDEIHKKVVEGVNNLFETYKQKYIDDYENVKLIIK